METLAHKYLTLGEMQISGIIYLTIGLGFVLALYAIPDKGWRLQRMAYFLLCCASYPLFILGAMPWLYTTEALLNGVLWVAVVGAHAAALGMGAFAGSIAVARSRDAYGKSNHAWMALIPLVNLVLLFKPSMIGAPDTRSKIVRFLAATFGIATGFFIFGSGKAIENIFDKKLAANNQRIETDKDLAGKIFEIVSESTPIEETLRSMKMGFAGREEVDEVTFLVAVDVDGNTLRRTLEVTRDDFAVTEGFRQRSNKSVCAFPAIAPLLRKGAIIEDVYILKSGAAVGTVVTTQQKC